MLSMFCYKSRCVQCADKAGFPSHLAKVQGGKKRDRREEQPRKKQDHYQHHNCNSLKRMASDYDAPLVAEVVAEQLAAAAAAEAPQSSVWTRSLDECTLFEQGIAELRRLTSGAHKWATSSHHRPTFCNFCSEKFAGVPWHGMACEVCKMKVHKKCANRISDPCKWTVLDSIPSQQQYINPENSVGPHQWLQGNLPMGSRCAVCDKACGSVLKLQVLQDWRCLWCGQCAHEGCLASASRFCMLGQTALSVLPPIAVELIEATGRARIRDDATGGECGGGSPLLVLVNSKSGDNQGQRLIRKLRRLLNPIQIFDLIVCGPDFPLTFFSQLESFRVLVCGGDGTVGWVLSALDRLGLHSKCQLGILPLGTGNDLARVLGWGHAFYNDARLPHLIRTYERAHTRMLDRWSIMAIEGADAAASVVRYEQQIAAKVTAVMQADSPLEVITAVKALCICVKELMEKVQSTYDQVENWERQMGRGPEDPLTDKCRSLLERLNPLMQELNEMTAMEESGVESCDSLCEEERVRRERLVQRANSLKKALFDMLEYAERSIDRHNRETRGAAAKRDRFRKKRSKTTPSALKVSASTVSSSSANSPPASPSRPAKCSLGGEVRRRERRPQRPLTLDETELATDDDLQEPGPSCVVQPPTPSTPATPTKDGSSSRMNLPETTLGDIKQSHSDSSIYEHSVDGASFNASSASTNVRRKGRSQTTWTRFAGVGGGREGGTGGVGDRLPRASTFMDRLPALKRGILCSGLTGGSLIAEVLLLNASVMRMQPNGPSRKSTAQSQGGSAQDSPTESENAEGSSLCQGNGEEEKEADNENNDGEGASLRPEFDDFMSPSVTLTPDYRELKVMNNYFGIGLDAKIALDFHNKREEVPDKQRSRSKLFMWYGILGGKELVHRTYRNLESRIRIECDGLPIDLPSLQGIVILNIPSYSGGANFWGEGREDAFTVQSYDDKVLEVVALFGVIHVATSRVPNVVRLQNHRIAQCRHVKITIHGEEPIPVQVDGEPWLQPPGVLQIVHKNRAQLLVKNAQSFDASLRTWEEHKSTTAPSTPTALSTPLPQEGDRVPFSRRAAAFVSTIEAEMAHLGLTAKFLDTLEQTATVVRRAEQAADDDGGVSATDADRLSLREEVVGAIELITEQLESHLGLPTTTGARGGTVSGSSRARTLSSQTVMGGPATTQSAPSLVPPPTDTPPSGAQSSASSLSPSQSATGAGITAPTGRPPLCPPTLTPSTMAALPPPSACMSITPSPSGLPSNPFQFEVSQGETTNWRFVINNMRQEMVREEAEIREGRALERGERTGGGSPGGPRGRLRSIASWIRNKFRRKRHPYRNAGSWTTDDVIVFLASIGLNAYAEQFKANEITGRELIHLERGDIHELGVVKLGHAKRLQNAIADIREHATDLRKYVRGGGGGEGREGRSMTQAGRGGASGTSGTSSSTNAQGSRYDYTHLAPRNIDAEEESYEYSAEVPSNSSI